MVSECARPTISRASWSIVSPLSELSEKLGSAPVKFPDFTRGQWQQQRALNAMVNV